MATKANAQEFIEIKRVEIRTANVRIRGTAPLIMHKWSEKAKKMILDKQTKATKTKGHDLCQWEWPNIKKNFGSDVVY